LRQLSEPRLKEAGLDGWFDEARCGLQSRFGIPAWVNSRIAGECLILIDLKFPFTFVHLGSIH
jgi:hypothetical protein